MPVLGPQLLKPMVVVGSLVAHVVLPNLPVTAPELEYQPDPVAVPQTSSLTDLYHLRDRLRADLDQQPTVMVATRSGIGITPTETLDQLWAINHRLRQEERARWLRHQAGKRAAAAIALGEPSTLPTVALAAAYAHWDDALSALDQMPADTFGEALAATQRSQYEQQRAIVAYHYDTARSDFLVPIVEQTGLAQQMRLTVCTLERECRRWQGHLPPVTPASLIKVPIAIALLTHLHQVGRSPETPIWVDPSNWTEDAGSLWVGSEYPLQVIMADMVSASGNIATNQLIDYMGWAEVNQQLQSRGYTTTRVTSKLVGASTYPANLGSAANVITTDELTDMMVAIYNQEIPGAELIQAALAKQADLALGHATVQPPLVWLGEKTGRTSKLLGTTTAVNISGRRYILTATLDHSSNEAALRTVLAGVMQHLLTHHGFDHTVVSSAERDVRSRTFLP
ncbi:serine hydrolase [Nodosilinea sp. E11]|uniref:serine hydrolase n=1 Tax=Nodosilinea sp. E11 TaxID=3037479 RepID=UPI0029352DF4|nr:serine hydrolase [Nodosilinea sp. E11]WOD37964.1 serine hydrolase [Nodosilinea sp. E11]